MTLEDPIRYIYNDLEEHIEVFTQLQEAKYLKTLESIAQRLIEMYELNLQHKIGNKSYWFGNGGSAEQSERFTRNLRLESSDNTARHLATEFTIRFQGKKHRPSLPAVALTDYVALTAAANDFGYDHIFSRQLEGYLKENDIAIGISTSGKSKNIIEGLETAKRLKAVTVAFTGKNGLPGFTPDYLFAVPSERTSVIQVAHLWGGQLICDLVDQYFVEKYGAK
ncbi:MAG: SIS domain-containing protein [Nanoarchaeota archaeon]